jgi:primosomal replication protein N
MIAKENRQVCCDIPLAVSQGTALENHDKLLVMGSVVPDVIFADATNSCAFLSLLVSDMVLEEAN